MSRALALLFVMALAGCVRRDGRNSDCKWPAEPKPLAAGGPHLSQDAEFAEELAIRYMDTHHGPRDPQAASQAKNRCMGILMGEIGKEHGISPQEAFRHFGQRSLAADLAMNLPFLLLFALAADFTARRLLGRYPLPVIALATVCFGAAGLVLAEQWSTLAEVARVGNWHLSNRALRLPIALHRGEIFVAAAALFAAIAAIRYRFR